MRDRPIARGLLAAGVAAAMAAACTPSSSGRRRSSNARPTPRTRTEVARAAAAHPAPPSFDFRLLRVQPRAHLGERHVCDVYYKGRRTSIGPREALRYPTPVGAHVPVECRALSGTGWVDVVVAPGDSAKLDGVVAGKRVRVRVLTAAGGFADYPVAELVSVVGAAPPMAPPKRPAPVAVKPAFDFAALGTDSHSIGTTHRCAVDFVGGIEIVDQRDRRFRRYPDDAQNRMTVKCKGRSGDGWVDLVFTHADALAALDVIPGRTVPLRIATVDGGFAGYPVVRWAGPIPSP